MYRAAGLVVLWRQELPDGPPEQITFGPLEEEGIALAPDGRSLVTSVGTRRSAIWIHDAAGERVMAPGTEATADPTHVTLIFNFFDELRRIAPVKK